MDQLQLIIVRGPFLGHGSCNASVCAAVFQGKAEGWMGEKAHHVLRAAGMAGVVGSVWSVRWNYVHSTAYSVMSALFAMWESEAYVSFLGLFNFLLG